MRTSFKIGEHDFVSIELELTDNVRDFDKNTSEAIDRVYGLVESKVAEKAQKYIDKS